MAGWKNNVTANGLEKDDKITAKDIYFMSVTLVTILCVFGAIIGGLLYLIGIDFGELLASIWILLALYSVVGMVIIADEYYDKD